MTNILSRSLILSVSTALIFVTGCANSNFKQLSASVLGSTGLMTEGQANALISTGDALSKVATPLTPEQEYYLGRAVAATILGQYKVVNDPGATKYLNQMVYFLAANSQLPDTFGGYHVVILDTEEVNAISAPGGFIFVSRGFIKKLHDEEMLAAVMAHELGHIALKHGVNAISQANLSQALLAVGKESAAQYGPAEVQMLTSTLGDSVKDVVAVLLKKGYSRSQEYDADKYGAALLSKSGYALIGYAEVFNALEKFEKDDTSGGWMDTHPSAEDRRDELEDSIKNAVANAGVPVRTARFASKKF